MELPASSPPRLLEPTESELPPNPPARLLFWLALPFFLLDLTLGPVSILEFHIRSSTQRGLVTMVIGLWMGLIAAQCTLWNLYFVLSLESLGRRVAVLLPQILLCSAAGILGFWFVNWYEDWTIREHEQYENVARYFCILPLIILAGQLPFACCRFLFGWHIQGLNPQSTALLESSRQPTSIASLMIATAAVAVAFAIVKLAPTQTLGEPNVVWMLVAVFGGIAGGFSLFGGVPLIVLLHFIREPLARLAWIFGLLLLGFAVSCLLYGYLVSWRRLLRDGPFNTLIFSVIIVTFLAGLSGYLRLLRTQGWTVGPR